MNLLHAEALQALVRWLSKATEQLRAHHAAESHVYDNLTRQRLRWWRTPYFFIAVVK
jgi:hypothetical protein